MTTREQIRYSWCFLASLPFGITLAFFHPKGTLMGWLQFFAVLLTWVFGCQMDACRHRLIQVGAMRHPLAKEVR